MTSTCHPTAKTQKIDKDTGKVVENPKGVARIQEKIAEKEKINGGEKVPMARITDATRGTFVLNSPSDARKVVDELAKSYEMIDEGWRTIPDTHYTDRPLLFRDPATGLIGEIQLSHPDLLKAKDQGGGHELYEERAVTAAERQPKIDGAQRADAEALWQGARQAVASVEGHRRQAAEGPALARGLEGLRRQRRRVGKLLLPVRLGHLAHLFAVDRRC